MNQLSYTEVKDHVVRIHLPKEWKEMEVEVVYDLEGLTKSSFYSRTKNGMQSKYGEILTIPLGERLILGRSEKMDLGSLHDITIGKNYEFKREFAYPDDED